MRVETKLVDRDETKFDESSGSFKKRYGKIKVVVE